MSFTTLEQRVDDENRRFNPAWTNSYLLRCSPLVIYSIECLATVVFEVLLVELKKADTSMAVDESTDAAQSGSYVCVILTKRNQLYCHYTAHYCRYVVLTGRGKMCHPASVLGFKIRPN